jgi:predicted transcriptional regulator
MTAALPIELKPEAGQKLAGLSGRTRQPAARAVEAIVSHAEPHAGRESQILSAIARGGAGMKAGRLVPCMTLAEPS